MAGGGQVNRDDRVVVGRLAAITAALGATGVGLEADAVLFAETEAPKLSFRAACRTFSSPPVHHLEVRS